MLETYVKMDRFVEKKPKKRGHGFTKALCKKAKAKRRNKK